MTKYLLLSLPLIRSRLPHETYFALYYGLVFLSGDAVIDDGEPANARADGKKPRNYAYAEQSRAYEADNGDGKKSSHVTGTLILRLL